MRGQILFSHGQTNAKGLAILFKYGTNYKIHKVMKDDNGRILIVDLCVNGERITICNLYAPNEDNLS